MATTYRDRIAEAVRRCGGQSELARRITERFPEAFGRKPVTPQRIQYLADRKRTAQGSALTAHIAAVAGLRAEWLATGQEPMDAEPVSRRKGRDPAESALVEDRRGSAMTELGMDVIREAFDVARAWLALPENERARLKRAIETLALQYRATAPEPPGRKPPKRAQTAKSR